MTENPLQQFMRTEKFFIELPSNGYYYTDEVEFTDSKEVGILPMTAMDEILLNTPDALLNGEGIKKAVESCVPSVSDANGLLVCDFEVLLLAMRKASYGDDMSFSSMCPKCEKANEYKASVQGLLDTVEQLTPPYEIEIEKNLKVYVKPYSFQSVTLMALESIETAKVLQSMNLSGGKINEDEILEQMKNKYTESIQRIAAIAVEAVYDGIDYLEINNDGVKQEVRDKTFILDWLTNLNKKTIDVIQNKISDIPIGINKNIDVICEHCDHEWSSEIEINPTDFFELGS